MMSPQPVIFDKEAACALSRAIGHHTTYHVELERLTMILAAYQSSYNHAATQEMGIGIDIGETEKFKNWPFYCWFQCNGTELSLQKHTPKELRNLCMNRKRRPRDTPDRLWVKDIP